MGRDESGAGVPPGAVCRCELCGAPAAVHCAADAAFLCAACDAKVHGANFLASRHRRTRLLALPEASAEQGEEDEGYASAASSCVSTADSASTAPAASRRMCGSRARAGTTPTPRRGAAAAAAAHAEAVLEGWAKRMGLAPGMARRRAAAAWRALRACGADAAAARVPPRVAMAAALWWEVAAGRGSGGDSSGDALRRLEACAHVPARVVVAVATSLLARARRRGDAVEEEGWGECAWAGPKSKQARS